MTRTSTPLDDLHAAVLVAAEELLGAPSDGGRGTITLERPPRQDLGDYSTNAALLLARDLGSQTP